MKSLFVIDLGSTKSSVGYCHLDGDVKVQTTVFEGYNPNRSSLLFFDELQKNLAIQSTDHVVVYGSGLTSEENKNKVKAQFINRFNVVPIVYDDIIGAAHALYQNNAGLIAIMGTGGCVAYYNGEKVTERSGGYGYLIDDLGGGLELAKVIVSYWLSGKLSEPVNAELTKYFGISATEFTRTFYENPNLKQLSAIPKQLTPWQQDETLKHAVYDYFHLFYNRHIRPLAEKKQVDEICLMGSIAVAYKTEIETVFMKNKMRLKHVIKYPIDHLMRYQLQINQ